MKTFLDWLNKESVSYEFSEGDRVQHYDGRIGTVESCVPGDGQTPWYFIKFDDGTQDRHTGDELKTVQERTPRRFRAW